MLTTPSIPWSQEWLEAVAHPSQPVVLKAVTTPGRVPNVGKPVATPFGETGTSMPHRARSTPLVQGWAAAVSGAISPCPPSVSSMTGMCMSTSPPYPIVRCTSGGGVGEGLAAGASESDADVTGSVAGGAQPVSGHAPVPVHASAATASARARRRREGEADEAVEPGEPPDREDSGVGEGMLLRLGSSWRGRKDHDPSWGWPCRTAVAPLTCTGSSHR